MQCVRAQCGAAASGEFASVSDANQRSWGDMLVAPLPARAVPHAARAAAHAAEERGDGLSAMYRPASPPRRGQRATNSFARAERFALIPVAPGPADYDPHSFADREGSRSPSPARGGGGGDGGMHNRVGGGGIGAPEREERRVPAAAAARSPVSGRSRSRSPQRREPHHAAPAAAAYDGGALAAGAAREHALRRELAAVQVRRAVPARSSSDRGAGVRAWRRNGFCKASATRC